jgi:hypothetical protein
MNMLQGKVPVYVRTFLIVDPPTWFGSVWKIMKAMLSPSFRERVSMVQRADLAEHLAPGYEQYLPDEMEGGCADTELIVSDYIGYRKYVESLPEVQSPSQLQGGSGHVSKRDVVEKVPVVRRKRMFGWGRSQSTRRNSLGTSTSNTVDDA